MRNVPCGVSRSRFSCDRYAEAPAADRSRITRVENSRNPRLPRRYADFSGILHYSSSDRPQAVEAIRRIWIVTFRPVSASF